MWLYQRDADDDLKAMGQAKTTLAQERMADQALPCEAVRYIAAAYDKAYATPSML